MGEQNTHFLHSLILSTWSRKGKALGVFQSLLLLSCVLGSLELSLCNGVCVCVGGVGVVRVEVWLLGVAERKR